ncbi:MAG: YfhO family protein [Lachnospiraceae bacterium]|nr:YfhO family protein [Lachnospiraceae bacterium]
MWNQKQSRKHRIEGKWFVEHSGICMGALSFLLPIWIMLVAFYISAIFPFGDSTFMRSDMSAQYVPFFSEFMRLLKAGNGIGYSWNVGLGTNFLALYGYYLASPFYWLGVLVPETYYIEFVSYLVILKIGFCGLTAYRYLYTRPQRMCPEDLRKDRQGIYWQGIALFFALGYALSGFLAAYSWNVMWLDSVALFPLILIGLEKLVLEGKPFLYCLTLAASILFNFYLSIMICIFLVLYFGYLFLAERKRKAFRNFVLFSLLAGGIAAVLLIPEACALLESDFGTAESAGETTSYFAVLDVLSRHCVLVKAEQGSVDSFWPNIYCGVCVFLLVPLYAVNERIPMRRRFGMLAMAGFMLVSFCTSSLDYIWHGMNYPDGLPARQSFIYILLLLALCHEGIVFWDFQDKKQCSRILHVYLFSVFIILFFEKFAYHENLMPGAEWLTLLFLTIYALLLYLAFSRPDREIRNVLLLLAVLTMTVEVHINTQATSVICGDREDYFLDMEEYQNLYNRISEKDKGFYRLELLGGNYRNEGSRIGFPAASVFSSTMNSKVKNMYTRLGLHGTKVNYAFDGNTAFTGALLNVKYMLHNTGQYTNSLHEIADQYDEKHWLYQNNVVLPFGYVASMGWDLDHDGGLSGIELQNRLTYDLNVQGKLFELCDTEPVEGGVIKFTAQEEGIYYGILLNENIGNVAVSGVDANREWGYMKKGFVFGLEHMDAGQSAYITGKSEGTQAEISVLVYRLNEDVLTQAISALSEQHLEDVRYDNTHISGSLHLEKEGRLILSIPYEKGWHIRLNGERVEPETFGGALIALDLQPGEYQLEMNYVPYGLGAGILVSIISALTVLFLGIRCKRKQTQPV